MGEAIGRRGSSWRTACGQEDLFNVLGVGRERVLGVALGPEGKGSLGTRWARGTQRFPLRVKRRA